MYIASPLWNWSWVNEAECLKMEVEIYTTRGHNAQKDFVFLSTTSNVISFIFSVTV